jgi:hypothetical protein
VEAVIGELVSKGKFPDNRENTANFAPKPGTGLRFQLYKSVSYRQIPYAQDQGIFSCQQGIGIA